MPKTILSKVESKNTLMDRAVSNKGITENFRNSTGSFLLLPKIEIPNSTKIEVNEFTLDPITPWVVDKLKQVLRITSSKQCYKSLMQMIAVEISSTDARKLNYQLNYLDNELKKIFYKRFPKNSIMTKRIFSFLTKRELNNLNSSEISINTEYDPEKTSNNLLEIQKQISNKRQAYSTKTSRKPAGDIQESVSFTDLLSNEFYKQNKYYPKSFSKQYELFKFNPIRYDPYLSEKYNSLRSSIFLSYQNNTYETLKSAFTKYSDFLKSLTNILEIFQILKFSRESLFSSQQYDNESEPIFEVEVYLETVRLLITFAVSSKLRSHKDALTPEDESFLYLPLKVPEILGKYSDYVNRLKFSLINKHLVNSTIEYFLLLLLFAKIYNFEWINSTESLHVLYKRISFEESIKSGSFNKFDRKWSKDMMGKTSDTMRKDWFIGDKLNGFEIFYIDDDDEVKGVGVHSVQIYFAHKIFKHILFTFKNIYDIDLGKRQFDDYVKAVHEKSSHSSWLAKKFFKYIGYFPVLIEYGFLVFVYEFTINEFVAPTVGENVAKINPYLGTATEFATSLFAPRPSTLFTSNVNKLLNQQVENKLPIIIPNLREIYTNIEVARNPVSLNAKFEPITPMIAFAAKELKNATKYKIPAEWRTMIKESVPLQNLMKAAKKVVLRELTNNQLNTHPYNYQAKSMGSKFELLLWFEDTPKPFVALDGIIIKEGKSFIGEAKLGFIPDEIPNLGTKGILEKQTGRSAHFEFSESKMKQMQKLSKLAEEYGFSGVLYYSNSDFVFQTYTNYLFSQNLLNVEARMTNYNWKF